ncbi:MAG: PTS mannose/fructose/sorbose/N-acetylgalactosamine transporter subunit IIC [Erysipelotrichaceae bacterium]
MYEAVVVGLILGTLWGLEKMSGTSMVIRPLVVSPIIGFALGDLNSGILIGASLELLFMGAIQVGAAVPPDSLAGAGLATAFSIMSGSGVAIAVTLALPIAILAQSIKVVLFIVRSWFMDFAMKLASDANIKGIKLLNYGGLLLQSLMYFIVAFIAILFGSEAVGVFVESIPDNIMRGLTVAGSLLPAVGFALLLQPMMNKKNFIYFIFGFVLIAYLQLPILAVTIMGVVLAFVIIFENKGITTTAINSEEEDLFDV